MYSILGLIFVSLMPFLWLGSQASLLSGNSQAIGNILGLIGSTLIVWQFVMRNRYFSRLFNDDYLSINEVHKFLGIWGMLLVFAHPLLETFSYQESALWILQFDYAGSSFEQSVSFGRAAILILGFTWVLSALLRRKLPYRLWRRAHLIVYAIMPLVILHAPSIGTFLGTFPAVRFYWWSVIGLWCVLVGWRLLGYFNVGKSRYKLIEKHTYPGGITRYVLMPKNKKLQPKPGQFMYVRGSFFSETHPFSVMEYDKATGRIAFGIKQVGKYTRQLDTIPAGSTVYLDGPYGVFTREGQNDQPKVVIAGGIGITPFVELMKRYANKNSYLIYANRNLDIALKRSEFKRELKSNYVDVVSADQKVNPPVISGLLDNAVLKQTLSKRTLESSKFFICGPPPFMAAVKKHLLSLGVNKKRIYTEEFSL